MSNIPCGSSIRFEILIKVSSLAGSVYTHFDASAGLYGVSGGSRLKFNFRTRDISVGFGKPDSLSCCWDGQLFFLDIRYHLFHWTSAVFLFEWHVLQDAVAWNKKEIEICIPWRIYEKNLNLAVIIKLQINLKITSCTFKPINCFVLFFCLCTLWVQ